MIRAGEAGLGTVEALVAIGLLGIVAAALAHNLAAATAARLHSSRQMMAVQRATSIVEQLRSGDRDIEADVGELVSEWRVAPLDGHPGLLQFGVTVRVADRQLVSLEGLACRP